MGGGVRGEVDEGGRTRNYCNSLLGRYFALLK